MIRFYMKEKDQIAALSSSCDSASLELEFISQLDVNELQAAAPELEVLVFDLADGAFLPDTVIDALGACEDEQLPPVLYILNEPADIELISEVRGLVNQDYAFSPVDAQQLTARLTTLKMLGARRRLTMETAITDRLTGLANRKYFLRRLEEEMYRSKRYKYEGSVLLVSLDFAIPDGELTEDTGTTVIRKAAEFLKGRLRNTDIVARYKWDSFAFLLPEISHDDSMMIAEDVRSKLENLDVCVDDANVVISIAIGLITYPAEGISTAIEMAEALEDCCLQAKTDTPTRIKSLSAQSSG